MVPLPFPLSEVFKPSGEHFKEYWEHVPLFESLFIGTGMGGWISV